MGEASPPIFAHSLPQRPQSDWELLKDHANAVAALAMQFASAFGAGDWGELVGRWHDLGKIQPAFQAYIRGNDPIGVPHAWVGALHSYLRAKRMYPAAAAIAAHHGALANLRGDEANGIAVAGTFLETLTKRLPLLKGLRAMLPADGSSLPQLPRHLLTSPSDALRVELFTRFLFSALIDADRLATARFYARWEPALTADDVEYDEISTLAERLDLAIDAMPAKGSPAVMKLRREVLHACRESARASPGLFTLTVPTGGGKTLSAMSFTLKHAQLHGLRRVIVVIPYTSIIEQSARVYRDVLNDPTRPGVNNVLEHHSNLDEQKLRENDARAEDLRKLAAESWNAPVIVTTTVQFFESLLGAHGSQCRKVHNIARSVILLDEVQTLPPHYLDVIIDVLTQLAGGYGCSILLSTATPPALVARGSATRPGLANAREVIADPSALAAAARRVRIEWRIERVTPYVDLAKELRDLHQVLAIVHRRDDARQLAEAIGSDAMHLSAAMCPAHRLAVIAQVRHRLASNACCRLISTQLIEAGVDVDFPVVYRSLAGLDSIAQSAGRCDREGRLTDAAGEPAGRMIVFRAETDPPPGTPRKAFESMQVLTQLGAIDPFEPTNSLTFFDELYRKIGSDERRVQPLRRALAFSAVADAFKMIDADTHAIVVPYVNESTGIDGPARIAAFRAAPTRQTVRALQPLIVQVRRYQLDALRTSGITMPVDDVGRFDVLCEGREAAYHPVFGLISDSGTPPAESLVV